MNKSLISPILIFRGRIQLGKIRKIFLLDLSSIPVSKTSDPPAPTPSCSSCSNHVPEHPYDSMPKPMPKLEPVHETPNEPQEKPNYALGNVRFGKDKVFTRRKMTIPESMQVQESN